jgi:hypothetical protein
VGGGGGGRGNGESSLRVEPRRSKGQKINTLNLRKKYFLRVTVFKLLNEKQEIE